MPEFDLRQLVQNRARSNGARRDWFSISNKGKDEAEVYIYDVIGDFWGFGVPAAEFVKEIKGLDVKKLTLRINSPGGLADDAIAMANAWREHPAYKVTIIDALGASAASFVGLASDEVLMSKGSRLMIHEASSGVFGHKRDFRKEAAVLEGYDHSIADMYLEKAGGSRAEWLERMEAETWYPDQAAVDIGLADGISGEATTQNRYDLTYLSIYRNTPADLLTQPSGTNGRLDKRQAEEALRDAGFPAAAAKALISRGWDALEPEEAAARALIHKLTAVQEG